MNGCGRVWGPDGSIAFERSVFDDSLEEVEGCDGLALLKQTHGAADPSFDG